MGRSFSAGASDRLKVANSSAINSLTSLTIMCWVYRTGGGGNNLGRICDKRDLAATGSAAWYLAYDDSVTEYFFDSYRWSSVPGAWRTTGDAAPLNTLHHLALTYSFSSTTNDAQFYINGVATGMEELSAPSGTVNSESVDLVIGNRNNNDRNFGGAIAEFSLHNRILSTREITGAANKFVGAHFSGCVCYVPIMGQMSPEPNIFSRNSAVVTGTSQVAHPPVIQRRNRSFVAFPESVGPFVGPFGMPFTGAFA